MVFFCALVNLSLFLRFKWHIALWQGGGGGGDNLFVLCKLYVLKLDSFLNLSMFPFNVQYAACLPHPKGALVESQPVRV